MGSVKCDVCGSLICPYVAFYDHLFHCNGCNKTFTLGEFWELNLKQNT